MQPAETSYPFFSPMIASKEQGQFVREQNRTYYRDKPFWQKYELALIVGGILFFFGAPLIFSPTIGVGFMSLPLMILFTLGGLGAFLFGLLGWINRRHIGNHGPYQLEDQVIPRVMLPDILNHRSTEWLGLDESLFQTLKRLRYKYPTAFLKVHWITRSEGAVEVGRHVLSVELIAAKRAYYWFVADGTLRELVNERAASPAAS